MIILPRLLLLRLLLLLPFLLPAVVLFRLTHGIQDSSLRRLPRRIKIEPADRVNKAGTPKSSTMKGWRTGLSTFATRRTLKLRRLQTPHQTLNLCQLRTPLSNPAHRQTETLRIPSTATFLRLRNFRHAHVMSLPPRATLGLPVSSLNRARENSPVAERIRPFRAPANQLIHPHLVPRLFRFQIQDPATFPSEEEDPTSTRFITLFMIICHLNKIFCSCIFIRLTLCSYNFDIFNVLRFIIYLSVSFRVQFRFISV